jgi:hypothetical protein
MTKGDLVCLSRCGELSDEYNMLGVIIEQVGNKRAVNNRVFRVWWTDGTVGNNVWDYDLKVMDENR